MTFFAPNGPRATEPAEPKQSAGWEALCPCGALAWWRAAAANGDDYSRTIVTYLIECVACPPVAVEEIA